MRSAPLCCLLAWTLVCTACGARTSPIEVTETDAAPACLDGPPYWGKLFGGQVEDADPMYMYSNEGYEIAVDDTGLFLSGAVAIEGPTCGPGSTRSDIHPQAFLARLDLAGNVLWQWRVLRCGGIASDGEGGAFFDIDVSGGLDLGKGPMKGARYFGRVDAQGNPVFFREMSYGVHWAAGGTSSVVYAGSCRSAPSEQTPWCPPGATPDSVGALRFAKDGSILDTLLIRPVPDPCYGCFGMTDATPTRDGGMLMTGTLKNAAAGVAYGNGASDLSPSTGGVFVARYDSSGTLTAHRVFGACPRWLAIASDSASDTVFVTGDSDCKTPADFGGGPIQCPGGKYQTNFIVALHADLSHSWSLPICGNAFLHSVVPDGAGNVAGFGRFDGELRAGGLVQSANSAEDSVILRVDHEGAPSSVRSWSSLAVNNVAYGADGRVLMTGYLRDSTDLGAVTLTKQPGKSGYVVALPGW